MLEANTTIKYGSCPKLSEKDGFECAGGTCSAGLEVDDIAAKALVGIATLECCPVGDMVAGIDHPCGHGRCADWHLTGKKALEFKAVALDQVKKLLSDPDHPQTLVAVMEVHQSFVNYVSGVYHSLGGWDPIIGYHLLGCFGYDDEKGAHLIWNSWKEWGFHGEHQIDGDRGLGWIMYGNSILGFYQVVPDGTITPPPEPEPPGPTPSPCKYGKAGAKIANFFLWAAHRKGRYFYMNPARENK